jgi:DNA modification methylase
MTSGDVSESAFVRLGGQPAHGAAAAPGGLVMIDPARITEFSAVRPVDFATVERILERLAVSQTFGLEHAVTGRINHVSGDVFILDGAHRSMAVLLGRDRGLPGFADMLVPMVVQDELQSDACDAAVAVQSNENTMLHKQMTFPDYAVFLARVRDTAHDAKFADDVIDLAKRTYASVAEWTEHQSAPSLRSRVHALLEKKQLNIIYNIVQALRPYTPVAFTSTSPIRVDTRAWDMFLICSGYVSADYSMRRPFPSVSEIAPQSLSGAGCKSGKRSASVRQISEDDEDDDNNVVLSRKTLDCAFFRGHLRRIRGDRKSTAFGTLEMATTFEHVLFMSAVAAMRATQAAKKQSTRQRKIAKTTFQSSFRSSDPGHGQRIGFAVRSVVKAWDKLADALNFKNVEDMVAPYILFERASMRILPIDRTRGWAPLEQSTTLLKEFCAERSPERIDSSALGHDSTMDAQLRIAATRFLDNVMHCATDNKLFGDNIDAALAVVKDFTAHPHPGAPMVPCLRVFINSLPALASRFPGGSPSATRQSEDPGPGGSTNTNSTVKGVSGSAPRVKMPARNSVANIRGSNTSTLAQVTSSRAGSSSSNANLDPAVSSDKVVSRNEEAERGVPDMSQVSAENAVNSVLSSYVCAYNSCFRNLLASHEKRTGKTMNGTVQLVLTDPPYNTRRDREIRNSAYDDLSIEDVQEAASITTSLLRPGGHAIIFCAPQQFKDWKCALEKHPEIIVDSMPMALVRAPGTYFQPPSRKNTTLVNMYELAVHATRRGEGRDGWNMVSYRTFEQVQSRFQGYCNVIDNVPRPSPGETLMRPCLAEDGTEHLRSEQKPVLLMRELIYRFSMAQDVVVDLFSGTYTTAAACLSMPDGCYRRFIGCERDKACHDQAQDRIREEFSKQYKKGIFGIQNKDILQAASVILSSSRSSRSTDWMQPPGHPEYSQLPEHITSFLAELWSIPEVSSKWGNIALGNWPGELLSQLEHMEEMNFNVLRAVDSKHFGLSVRRSTIPQAGYGVFGTRNIKKGEIVGWYNGTLVYRDINTRSSSMAKFYGPRFLGCTVDRFAKYGLQLQHKLDGTTTVYIVPPKFCVATMMNDPREVGTDGTVGACSREPNVAYRESAIGLESLTNPFLVELVAICDISVGSELFIDYGDKFNHWADNGNSNIPVESITAEV